MWNVLLLLVCVVLSFFGFKKGVRDYLILRNVEELFKLMVN